MSRAPARFLRPTPLAAALACAFATAAIAHATLHTVAAAGTVATSKAYAFEDGDAAGALGESSRPRDARVTGAPRHLARDQLSRR